MAQWAQVFLWNVILNYAQKIILVEEILFEHVAWEAEVTALMLLDIHLDDISKAANLGESSIFLGTDWLHLQEQR